MSKRNLAIPLMSIASTLTRWKDRFLQSALVRRSRYFSKKIVLPGFNGLTLYQVLQFTFVGLRKGRITNRAAAVCFQLLLAVPPLLIVLISIIPFIPIANFQENLFDNIARIMPYQAFRMIEDTLDDLINNKQQTLISLSFLLALFYSSNAVQAFLEGFASSYHVQKGHKMHIKVGRSFGLMLVFSLVMILGVALITFSGPLLTYLEDIKVIGSILRLPIEIGKWILIIFMFEIAISLLYRASLSGKWRALNAGASFATLGIVIVSLLFAWYVNNFGNYNKLYGSLGTILVVMLWLYFNTIVLLIGFEINAAIAKAKTHSVSEIEPQEVL